MEPQRKLTRAHALFFATCLGAAACGGSGIADGGANGANGAGASNGTGSGAGGVTGAGAAGVGGGGGVVASGGGPPGECVPAVPQRLVRLTYRQLANGVGSLLGPDAQAAAATAASLPGPVSREFQALFAEGELIIAGLLRTTMSLTDAAAGVLAANYAVTGCAVGDEVCAQQFLAGFAQNAFRRPPTAEEQAAITQLYTTLRGLGLTVEESVRFGVEGLLLSPQALYRTEFGQPVAGTNQAPLTAYELASQVSYFMTDGPPDPPLLAAAASGALATPEGLGAEVDRLLATDAVKQNLSQVLLAYYGAGNIFPDIKDPALYPEYTTGLKNSMYTETQLFIENTMWAGTVDELLTSKTYFVNQALAAHYGVAYPGPVEDPADIFRPVLMPDTRSGLLTQASILTFRSRPDTTSVVSRGLFINGTILCLNPPPEPPGSIADQVSQLAENTTLTERQKAEVRAETPGCGMCHANFDAYGLVLENYDAIGRYRTAYPNGTAIDATTPLPIEIGGAMVTNVAEFVNVIAPGGVFSRCLASSLMKYALTENQLLASDTCAVQQVHDQFQAGNRSLASLVREVTLSPTLTVRATETITP